MSETPDRFAELRDNRAAMAEFFASKGWEILFKWAQASVARDYETAIRGESAQIREEARVTGLAKEEFIRLPFFLAEQAGLNTADEAPKTP